MEQKNNFLVTVGISVFILILWQIFYINPHIEEKRKLEESKTKLQTPYLIPPEKEKSEQNKNEQAISSRDIPKTNPEHPDFKNLTTQEHNSKRIHLETPSLTGSINLIGGRIDDLKLKNYRETVEKNSPEITLLKPQSGVDGYFVETGFTSSQATGALPGPETVWKEETHHPLSPSHPIILSFSNDKGLTFLRTIAVDDHYMFTVSDKIKNTTKQPVVLFSYGRVTRFNHEIPPSNYILHEGLISLTEKEGLQEITYTSMIENKQSILQKSSNGWLGITDKYWSVALIPSSKKLFQPRLSWFSEEKERFQADFITDPISIPSGEEKNIETRIFAGAKEVGVIYDYQNTLKIPQFELMIDWGWFYFITNPMFRLIDIFYKILGNFGLAILATTVLVKIFFFPLASKSYKSMANMKKIQPKILELREKYKDDKIKQHQAIMELYKSEKINPVAGCWPVLVQIPVFFSLYKVLYVTIEMRHAAFFGWIHDLAAPDPLSVFNLFGLLNFTPPSFLMIGAWPIIMGITMFLQMRMNPTPPDPTQAMIFNWMPVLFTFMLASFPSGLVIYWAWSNFLSILQQAIIMKYYGAKIELWDNIVGHSNKKSDI